MAESRSSVDAPTLNAVVTEFVGRIDSLFGLYLDATIGFDSNLHMIEQAQAAAPTSSDTSALFLTDGAPTDPRNVLLHKTTQGAFKDRNRRNGPNYIFLARILIAFLYELWETEYRARIAAAAGIQDPSTLTIPLFGDLRLLRHVILHKQGVVDPDTARRLEIINAPSGHGVDLDKDGVERLVTLAKEALDKFIEGKTGEDPKHRTIWHVQ